MSAVSLEFIKIASPDFKTFAVFPHTVEMGSRAVGWDVGEGDIVRVQYTATREEDAAIDKDAIRRELLAAGASRVTIEPQITREVRARVETLTQELGPLEAIAMYGEAQGLEVNMCDEMRQRLREWIG